ncbi:MAG: hypothetical protein ABFS56_16510 [Pseudomonadota bacterium]
MSDKVFSIQEDITEEYQRNFKKPGVIGYFKNPHEPEKKIYELYLETGELILLGNSVGAVHKRLQDIYYAEQLEMEFLEPTAPKQKAKQKTEKLTPKRRRLLEQVSKIKTWGRGVIAKIAENLGRKVGAVRQMLSVLTKKGLLVRIQRGQYAVGTSL